MILLKKTKIVLIIALFICIAAPILVGCQKQDDVKFKNQYNLTLEYDSTAMALKGEENVKYFNTSENSFEQLFFHLYPNAFRKEAKNKVVSISNWDKAYENGESYGCISILSVCYADNSNADFSIGGEDANILIVDLQEELFPDECVEIIINFEVKLAMINHRLGVGENTINFGNFYPIACVYEDGKGFSQNLYHSNGDPFYSECANYNVKVRYKSVFDIASTGDIVEQRTEDEFTITVIEAKNVRDFCFVLSANFDKVSQEEGNTTINYYGYKNDENMQKCLTIAVDAVRTFNEMFGLYPYSQLSVVKSNFIHGGMEYPNIVLVSDIVNQEDCEYVIVHEIAHQWWYGVVGNDQYNHAWQDEALAEYSTLLFFEKNSQYGLNYDEMIDSATQSYKTFAKVYKNVNGFVDGIMDKSLCEFQTEPEYVQCTYTKGVMMMDSIRNSIGYKKLIKALKKYYNENQFLIARPEDLIAVFNKVSGGEMEGFIRSWLDDKVRLL